MISPKRLSKIIQEKESKIAENYLMYLYEQMTDEQRKETKDFLKKICKTK